MMKIASPLFLSLLLLTVRVHAGARFSRWSVPADSAQSPPASASPAPDVPSPKRAGDAEAVIAEARRLSRQGKYDEAIAQLETLAASRPALRGLSHELGLAYYKKGLSASRRSPEKS